MSTIFNSADIAETMNNGVSNVTGADSTITENYTNVVQHGIVIDMSVSEKTISGEPPLTFSSKGTPLIDYTIYGNTIESQSCGVITDNLFDNIIATGFYDDSGTLILSATTSHSTTYIPVSGTTYTASRLWYNPNTDEMSNFAVYEWDANKNWLRRSNRQYPPISNEITFIIGSDTAFITLQIQTGHDGVMLNTGSTALPYEPYGEYKIPVSINGQTNNIYIGNDPLRKAVDSSNAVDTINYGTQQITRRVDSDGTALSEPVTESIEVPQILTIDGTNTLDVQTTPKPSNISITYKGR